VLARGEIHRGAVDGEVDVADDWTLLDLHRSTAGRTSHIGQDLFDHKLDVGDTAFVVEDADVL
jgi:hypothetical protein